MKNLIEKLANAEGGDRELDVEIAVLIRNVKHGDQTEVLAKPDNLGLPMLKKPEPEDECEAGTYWLVTRGGWVLRAAPNYTTSVDAALTLVPENWDITLEITSSYRAAWLRQISATIRPDHNTNRPICLALCIAALKARQSEVLSGEADEDGG